MKLVKQENGYDCGQACLAMVLGKDIKYVKNLMGRHCTEKGHFEIDGHAELGVCESEISWILYQHGINHHVFYPPESFPEKSWIRNNSALLFIPTIENLSDHVRFSKAILGVPSLNVPNGSHWIAVDSGEVFDPSPKTVYTSLQQVHVISGIFID